MLETTVVLSDFFSWAILKHILRAVITYNICHTMLKDKYNTFVTFLSILTVGLAYTAATFQFYDGMKFVYEVMCLFIYHALIFIVLVFTTEGKIFSKIAATSFSFLAYWISSMIPMLFFTLINEESMYLFTGNTLPLSVYLPLCTITFAFSFLFVIIINFVKLKSKKNFNYRAKYILFLFYPFTHCVSVAYIMLPYIMTLDEKTVALMNASENVAMSVLMNALMLIIDFFIFFFVDHFEKTEDENLQKEREILKLKTDSDYTVMLSEEKQEFRKLKHDFSNIIATAAGFIEIEKYDKAYNILKNTDMHLHGLAGFSLCSNETVNTVIYIKKQYAEQNGITMFVEINENYAVNIDDYDLCRLLHNIIDNCINAVSKLNSEKQFSVLININEDLIEIKTANKFNVNEKSVRQTKSDEHGNGIKIAKEIASKYGGKYVSEHSEDTWFVSVFLSNKQK